MMKTIFSLLLILFSLNSYSSEVLIKTFDIENRNQQYSFVIARASSLANKVIRDNSYLFYVDPKKDSNYFKLCWKGYLINKRIKIDIVENSHKLIRKTNKKYTFEVFLDPTKIKVKGASKRSFLNFCKDNN